MTTPSTLPTGFDGTYKDYLKAKVDRDGCTRMQYRSVTIADNATAGTAYGIVPFRKGFRLSYGSRFGTTDLDTASNAAFNLGYAYKTGSTGTDDADAFGSALAATSAAVLTFDEKAGLSWVAVDDGWITATLSAGPVTTAGTLEAQIVGCYDGLASDN